MATHITHHILSMYSTKGPGLARLLRKGGEATSRMKLFCHRSISPASCRNQLHVRASSACNKPPCLEALSLTQRAVSSGRQRPDLHQLSASQFCSLTLLKRPHTMENTAGLSSTLHVLYGSLKAASLRFSGMHRNITSLTNQLRCSR